MRELVRLLEIAKRSDDVFVGAQPTHWERNRVYGGQVAAQALMAAIRTVDATYRPHSLHSYFLLPGGYQVPITYEVERIRDGRSFMTRRVVARQEDRAIYAQTASFHRDEPGLEHQDPMPPAVPPPHASSPPAVDPDQPESPAVRFWDAVEVQWVDEPPLDSLNPASRSRSLAWMRIRRGLPDDPALHAAAFTFASDLSMIRASLAGHDIDFAGIQAASLDHTIWFHQLFAADRWWLYEQASPAAHGARGLAIAKVFTSDGRLVASSAQESLIRQIEPASNAG